MNDWFTGIGTPARNNNSVLPLVDGEKAWNLISSHLENAKKTIHMCFWMTELDLEMRRPVDKTFKDPQDRMSDTLKVILFKKQREGVSIRVLMWEPPWSTFGGTSLDHVLHLAGHSGLFEVMYESHPDRVIGSWHQKTIIVDNDVAFVGGMNAKENDWDTTKHDVFDYRRSPHKSSGAERTAWKKNNEMTHFPPRHDLMAMIRGPLVADVAANFVQRWNAAKEAGVRYHQHATKLPKVPPPAGTSNVTGQIVRTIPAKFPPVPTGEQGIQDIYLKAIRSAKQYVYIEDQYFRSQVLARELASACKRNPRLLLLVVTPPDYLADLEPGEFWKVASILPPSTYWTARAFSTIRAVRKDFCLFYLQVDYMDSKGKQHFVPVDLHAKVMIVDDEWYTIGSCNINDRGFQYEGELNVAVHHESAMDLRKELFTEHLQTSCPDKIQDAVKLWYDHATYNWNAWNNKTKPRSRVYPFVQNGPQYPVFPYDWL